LTHTPIQNKFRAEIQSKVMEVEAGKGIESWGK
jgi:hypothetical protein